VVSESTEADAAEQQPGEFAGGSVRPSTPSRERSPSRLESRLGLRYPGGAVGEEGRR